MANRKAARIIALGGIVIAVGVGGPGPLARLPCLPAGG